jgi:hypothetical protein
VSRVGCRCLALTSSVEKEHSYSQYVTVFSFFPKTIIDTLFSARSVVVSVRHEILDSVLARCSFFSLFFMLTGVESSRVDESCGARKIV